MNHYEQDIPFIILPSQERVDERASSLIDIARANRQKPTEAESIMWKILRGRFCGVRFRRQHVIAGFIADFACVSKKLIIEIDGGYHFTEEQIENDAQRTKKLNDYGYTVMRFKNEEVLANTDLVIERIKKYIIKEQI